MTLKQVPTNSQMVPAIIVSDSNEVVIGAISADVCQVGQKALGLTSLPSSWVPRWFSVPLATCDAAVSQRINWLSIAEVIVSQFSRTTELIIRSSSPNEDLDTRGHFYSQKCSCTSANELAQVLQKIALQLNEQTSDQELDSSSKPICAPIVQAFLPATFLGHLSNEYRHAQRNIDFLYEVEEISYSQYTLFNPKKAEPEIRVAEPKSFRLDRPVQSINTGKRIQVGTGNLSLSLERSLRNVGRWIASEKLRAHLEWLVYEGDLYVVQIDVDQLPSKIRPMSRAPHVINTSLIQELKVFSPLQLNSGCANLRKTRSHHLLKEAHAFVPPIYVAQNIHLLDWNTGNIPLEISDDLTVLCASQVILRFDVPYQRSDWTNLPTIGPINEPKKLEQQLRSAIERLSQRGIPLNDVTLVAHHFIAARASAWSEARADSDKVRIDATWGLPDGLQTFAHDTYIWDLSNSTFKPDIRYKDRFIDVEEDGQWTTRKAYPKLAREWCCEKASIMEIAQVTARVARICNGPVRIMWFLDVIAGTGGQSRNLMPWIVVEPDADEQASWANLDSWFEEDENLDIFRRKAKLATSKFVSNMASLELFEKTPSIFDLGGKVLLLQPDETVLRNRSFLERFAEVIKSNSGPPWKILYEGSILAHTLYQLRKLGVDIVPLLKQVHVPRRVYSRKLVRDLIPQKISQSGESVDIKELNDEDYLYALRQKLIEEALEVAYADERDDVIEELADVIAVVKALANSVGSSWEEVNEEELRKHQKRGGFEERLYLQASGYDSVIEGNADNDIPGSVVVRKIRRGQKNGVRIPLVPPLRSGHAVTQHNFSTGALEVIVNYKEHDVEVFFSKKAHAQEQNGIQLSLFDDLE